MQTVMLFAALASRYPLVDPGEMDVAARLLLALVSFRADFVELFVVPAIALEAADVVEAPLVADTCRQGLDAQVKGDDAVLRIGCCFRFLRRLPVCAHRPVRAARHRHRRTSNNSSHVHPWTRLLRENGQGGPR